MPRAQGSSGERGLWYEREVSRKAWEPSDLERLQAKSTFSPTEMTTAEREQLDKLFGAPLTREEIAAARKAINPYAAPLDNGFSGNWEANTGGNTGTGDIYDATASFAGLTRGEQLQVEAYWTNMQKEGGALYWNVYFSEPDADGMRFQRFTPLAMASWNIENDGENWGWKDAMIGEIQRRLTSGPEWLKDGSEGIMATQPRVGGGGGGRGGGGPKYVAPMRDVVEDTVKAMLTALTGDESESLIQKYSDMYETASKQRWDVARAGGTDVDPNQVILEEIRKQEDYKSIHSARAAGESETKWIGDRMARLTQLGVTSGDADDRAIWLAQAGTNLNDIDTGAFQTSRGRKDITLMGKIQKAANDVAGQL